MTEPTLLDENAISKIEARIAKRDDTTALESACGEYNCSCHYDIPALCATVKHLREVNQGIIDGIADGKKILHDQIESLQSQLEQLRATLAQVEQERDTARETLRRKSRELMSIKGRCHA